MYIPQPRIFRMEKFTANFYETTSATATAPLSTHADRGVEPLNFADYGNNISYMEISDNIGLTKLSDEYRLPVGKYYIKLEVLQRHKTSDTTRFTHLQTLYFKDSDATATNVIYNKTLTEVRDTSETDGTGNTILSITSECHAEVTSGTSGDLQIVHTGGGFSPLTYPYGNVYKYILTIEQLDPNQTYFNTAQSN